MSNHDDDKLNLLRETAMPAPSEAARRRAVDEALLAFDTRQAAQRQATQGTSLLERLRSVLATAKGTIAMHTRLSYGLGTAAVALLLLPLGYQLYTSTAITPLAPPQLARPEAPVPAPVAEQQQQPPAKTTVAGRDDADATVLAEAAPARDEAADAVAPEAELRILEAPQEMDAMADAPAGDAARKTVAPTIMAAPQSAVAPAQDMLAAAPAPEPMLARPTDPSGDSFERFSESPLKSVAAEPVSTFSIDVDTASYAYVRRALTEGWVPEPDAVRIEELVNYFDYDYPAPTDAATPFKPTVALYPTPWNPKTQILQIGIKGYTPPAEAQKPANLVFLIDTSGSMDEPDKLPLLKRAFGLLVDRLGAEDTVSIVAYAGSAGVVLEPTSGSDRARILGALDNLAAGGSTAGAEGIELAYRLAEQHRVADGVNRVILATDGDFNVGIEDPEDLKTFIKGKRDAGVFLSVLGFGQGNLGDDTMQALAQNGNGNASYIDSFKEAQKVLVADAGGTLETIAKDVKIQVEFNPAEVSEYRLIGYETRALNREDFNNDRVDAGEIGAGATVTALYEITPVGSGAELVDPLRYEQQGTAAASPVAAGEIGYLKLRYKLPEGDSSTLVEQPILESAATPLAEASTDARFAAAVAAFGAKLKGSSYGDMDWDAIRTLAQSARGTDENGYRAEFVQLIDMARTLAPDAGN